MSRPDALAACVARHRDSIDRATRPVELTDGSTVGVARFGRGPMVVCVPTITELNFVYAPQIEALSDRYELVLYQPRLSRTRRVSLADRVRELVLVLDALEAEPAHLLAWSDAGSVAYRAARLHPGRLASVAFLGLPDQYRFPGPLRWFADALYRYPIGAAVPSAVIGLLLSHFLAGPRIPSGWVFGESRRITGLSALFKHSILPCMLEHRPVAGPLGLPSLMVAGTRDALVGVDRMRAMARLLGPRCEVRVVAGGEHILPYANPDAVNQSLARFYDRLAPPLCALGRPIMSR